MNLCKYNETTRKREPLSETEAKDAIKFSEKFDAWQREEDRAFDYIVKYGANKFHDLNRYKRLDRARDSFLGIYNKVFKQKLRPEYDFHLVKELESRLYRDAVKGGLKLK